MLLGGKLACRSERELLFSLKLRVPGLMRPLQAQEFSDGQLRFLCYVRCITQSTSAVVAGIERARNQLCIPTWSMCWRG